MTKISEDSTLRSSQIITEKIGTLKHETETIKTTLFGSDGDKIIIEEKAAIFDRNLSLLQIGMEDAQLIATLLNYLQFQDGEKLQLRLEAEKFRRSNEGLVNELCEIRKNLSEAYGRIVELEETNKELEFLVSLKKYEENVSLGSPTKVSEADMTDTLQELGFDPDEEEQGQFASNPAANIMAASSLTGLEISQKLRTLHNLVIKYAANGQYAVAVPLCKEALKNLRNEFGDVNCDVATMLNILAIIYRDQKKYDEALEPLNEALTIREKLFGRNHPIIAHTLNNLAVLCGKRGKLPEAEPLCQRALEIRIKCFGPDHSEVAKQYGNFAFLYQNLKKYFDAEENYKKALEIYETKLNNKNPADSNITKTKNNLAMVYAKQGKYMDAEKLYKDILTAAHKQAFGNEISVVIKPIWKFAEEREIHKELDVGIYQANAEWQIIFKWENSKDIFTAMKHLGSIYCKQGKYQAAETIEDALLRVRKQKNPSLFLSSTAGNNVMDASMMASMKSVDNPSISMTASRLGSQLLNAFGLKQ